MVPKSDKNITNNEQIYSLNIDAKILSKILINQT